MPAGTSRAFSWPLRRVLGTQRVMATTFLCAYCTLCVCGYQTGPCYRTGYMTRRRGPGRGAIAATGLGGELHRYTRDMLGMSLCACYKALDNKNKTTSRLIPQVPGL